MDVNQELTLYNRICSKNPGVKIRNLRPFRDMVIILSCKEFLEGKEFTIKHYYGNRKPRILQYTHAYLQSCMKDIIITLGETDEV